jgi:hypothetical protein
MRTRQEELEGELARLCESPIETLMAKALVYVTGQYPSWESGKDGERLGVWLKAPDGWTGAAMIPQLRVETVGKRYRLDLALWATVSGVDRFVAVECDGHDFHDRTKEQASSDRARDRSLQSAGWIVARFTGRDIRRDPAACAREAWGMLAGGGDQEWPEVDGPNVPSFPLELPQEVAARPPSRVSLLLPPAAVEALAVFMSRPELANVAAEESLPRLLPAGPLADLARDLIGGPVALEEALARITLRADAPTLRRVKDVVAVAGNLSPSEAEVELRRACIKAAISEIRAEQDRLLALIARKGAVPEDLAIQAEIASRRRVDLEKRLRALGRLP